MFRSLAKLLVLSALLSLLVPAVLAQAPGGDGPGVGGGAKENKEDAGNETKSLNDNREGNYVEFDGSNLKPLEGDSGPDKATLDRMAGLDESGGAEEDLPEEDTAALEDAGKLTVEGTMEPTRVEARGTASFPDETRISLALHQKGKRLPVMGAAFVKNGRFEAVLESPGRLSAGQYTIQAEFLKSQQPLEVRDALAGSGIPERVVAKGKVGADDPVWVLTEELELRILFFRILASYTARSEELRGMLTGAADRSRYWQAERFDATQWANDVTRLRVGIDETYQVVKKEEESYLTRPFPQVWDRFRTLTNFLLDATVAGTTEVYKAGGAEGVEPPAMPPSVSLYYFPRPNESTGLDLLGVAEGELGELRVALGLNTARDLEKHTLVWAVAAAEGSMKDIEKLADLASDEKNKFEASEWMRSLADWKEGIGRRSQRLDRYVQTLKDEILGGSDPFFAAEFEQAKGVFAALPSLEAPYWKEVYAKRKLETTPEVEAAPAVSKAVEEIDKLLAPVKSASKGG
ncbi:MAG: hypothetical protein HY720_08430 [Planctomycetes bacterium]|nr:hypothetical protein [Planctomycetota bacterium]